MKYTRKFLDGYITYDENDAIVNADSFFGFIFKSIASGHTRCVVYDRNNNIQTKKNSVKRNFEL